MNHVEQQRINRAYDLVAKINDASWAEWSTIALGFGPNVQRCGLLQTMAFVHRDGKEGNARLLAESIRDHLIARQLLEKDKAKKPLLDSLRGMDADRFMLITREVLAYSVWLKRATQAMRPAGKLTGARRDRGVS